MRRITLLALPLVAVLAMSAAACGPDVALSSGDDPAAADAQPPDEAPFVKGAIVSVAATQPVTTGCVSESDLDPDGSVSSDDPPVCNPAPSTFGSVHVKGEAAGGGETEIVAGVGKAVPLVRRGAGGDLQPVDFSELAKGDAVSLWITGPVAESYPLQGTASFVIVEE